MNVGRRRRPLSQTQFVLHLHVKSLQRGERIEVGNRPVEVRVVYRVDTLQIAVIVFLSYVFHIVLVIEVKVPQLRKERWTRKERC